ncbi:hypothetical protein Tco_1356305 [Tanacetum coccineum]
MSGGRSTHSTAANNVNPPNELEVLTEKTEKATLKVTVTRHLGLAALMYSSELKVQLAYCLGWKSWSLCSILASALLRAKSNSQPICCKDEPSLAGTTWFRLQLARVVPHMVTLENKRVDRYILGPASEISGTVTSSKPTDIENVVSLANRMTDDAVRDGVFKKESTSKKKRVGDQLGNRGGNN